jgi:hypothetical protein
MFPSHNFHCHVLPPRLMIFPYLCHFVIFVGWRTCRITVYHFSSLNLFSTLSLFPTRGLANSQSLFFCISCLHKSVQQVSILVHFSYHDRLTDLHSHLISSTLTPRHDVSFLFHNSQFILNVNSTNSMAILNSEKVVINDVSIEENHIYFRLMFSSSVVSARQSPVVNHVLKGIVTMFHRLVSQVFISWRLMRLLG